MSNSIMERHAKIGAMLHQAGFPQDHPAMQDWAAIGFHIRELEATLERVRELPEKLRRPSAHTYASENADVYAAYDRGRKSAADELEAALQSDAGAGSNQPEVDNPKSAG